MREQKPDSYDCIMIGAGVRTLPEHFLLFEKLINVVHAEAPSARIAFNTKPSDTAEAVPTVALGLPRSRGRNRLHVRTHSWPCPSIRRRSAAQFRKGKLSP